MYPGERQALWYSCVLIKSNDTPSSVPAGVFYFLMLSHSAHAIDSGGTECALPQAYHCHAAQLSASPSPRRLLLHCRCISSVYKLLRQCYRRKDVASD